MANATQSTSPSETNVDTIIAPESASLDSGIPNNAENFSDGNVELSEQIPREETRIVGDIKGASDITVVDDVAKATGERKIKIGGSAKPKNEIARDVLKKHDIDPDAKKAATTTSAKTVNTVPQSDTAVRDTAKAGTPTPMSVGVSLICLQGLSTFEDKTKAAQRAYRAAFLSTMTADVQLGHILIARKRIETAPTDRGRRMVGLTDDLRRAITNGLQVFGQEVEKTRQREEDQEIDTIGSEQKLAAIRETLREMGDQRDLFPKREEPEVTPSGTDKRQTSIPGTEPTKTKPTHAAAKKQAVAKNAAKKTAAKKSTTSSVVRAVPKTSQLGKKNTSRKK